MTRFSGAFSGKSAWQTSVSLKDQPNHEMMMGEIAGPQRSSDKDWNNAHITYWSTIDLVAGDGTQRGYYLNARSNGENDFGSFEGKVSFAGGEGRLEGTWRATGGTGKYSGITAQGSYRGRLISPTEVEMTWDGEYELSSK